MIVKVIGVSIIAIATILGATPARAADRPACAAIAVAEGESQKDDAAALGSLLESVLRQSGRVSTIDLADAADRSGAQSRADKAKAAGEALALARKAYDSLDVDAANQQAQRAIALGARAPLSQRREALTQALLIAGASRYYGGDEPGAREQFFRLFGIEPQLRLDPADWSPEVVQVAESERSKGAASRRGEISVRTEPVPARLYVDGVFAGVAPLLLRGLAPGPHELTASSPGYEQRDLEVSPGSETTLALPEARGGRGLLALEKQLANSFGSKEGDEALRQIGRDAGAEQILGARIEARGHARTAHLLLLQVADGKRLGDVSGDLSLGSAPGIASATALIRKLMGSQ